MIAQLDLLVAQRDSGAGGPLAVLLRFLAGLGIGGALPTATTLAAEFTPARKRTLAVTATIVCVPLGGMLAGIYASHIIPAYGWRALFWIGGALPAVFGVLLVALLPEMECSINTEPLTIAAIYPNARHPPLNVRAVIDYYIERFGTPLYWQT